MNKLLTEQNVKWVLTNVIGWGFLAVILYYVATGMVNPMRDAHLRLVEKTVDTSGRIVETQHAIVETQAKQVPILDRIDKNTSK